MWYYNDKPFTSDMIGDYLGFVYEITDTPLKGAKRKRIKIVETDWAKYYGSNETVKQLVEELGPEIFHRKIIRLCKSKGELNYYEAQRQFETDCLLKPDEYYNAFIGVKINRSHVLTKKLLTKSSK